MNMEQRIEPEEHRAKRPYEDPMDSLNKMRQHSGEGGLEPELYGAESFGCFPFYPGFLSQEYEETPCSLFEYSVYLGEQHMSDCSVTHRPCPFTPVSTSVAAIASTVSSVVNPLRVSPTPDTHSPIRLLCCPTASAWDALGPTPRSHGCSVGDPVSAAAHLHLLGESLSLIGHHLQETNKVVCAPGSLSLLLDSLLCALPPLISLAAQIPELKSCTRHSLESTMENIVYLMPGL